MSCSTSFCVWSGEDTFLLTTKDRDNLRRYLLGGGSFSEPRLLGCELGCGARKELKLAFPEHQLVKIPMSHPIFSTVKQISRLTDKHGASPTEGLEINGRLVMIYSKDGLNDVENAKGCAAAVAT
jgi:hypothetical protein